MNNIGKILLSAAAFALIVLLGIFWLSGRDSATEPVAEEQASSRIEIGIQENASAHGLSVVPQEVLEDSRCPAEVQCIQAGTVRLRALLSSALGEGTQIFILNQPITTEAEEVTLIEVSPKSRAGVTIAPGEYRFIFEIKKR